MLVSFLNSLFKNCEHNTEGPQCEHCKSGYFGNARQGTPNDCLPLTTLESIKSASCNPNGTLFLFRNSCICKVCTKNKNKINSF